MSVLPTAPSLRMEHSPLLSRLFAFNETHTIGLSVFRLVLTAIVLRNAFAYLPLADELFGPNAIAPYSGYLSAFGDRWYSVLYYPFEVPGAAQVFLCALIGVAFLHLLAVGGRVTGLVMLAMLTILRFRNGLILDGSDNVIQVTLPFLLLAPSYRHFGYKTLWPAPVQRLIDRASRMTPFQMILACAAVALMVQVSYIYFFTALSKAQGTLWQNGTAVFYTMRVDEFRATEWNIPLTQNHYFVVFATYSTLVVEFAFPFLVWFRKTRPLMLLAGVGLHVGIWYFMRIDNFSWIMIGSYTAFLTNAEYGRARDLARTFVVDPVRARVGGRRRPRERQYGRPAAALTRSGVPSPAAASVAASGPAAPLYTSSAPLAD